MSNAFIDEDLTELQPDELIPDWVIASDTSLHYIPMNFQQKMTMSFYKAYVHVIETILLVFYHDQADEDTSSGTDTTDTQCIPTVDAITHQLGPENADTQAFFDAGGEITFALEALVDRAYEKSPEGPEYARKADLREEEEEFENETQELPRCVHDLDFGLVRVRLGLPERGKGPHWFFLTDDEDSEGEGDEEEEGEAVYVGKEAEGVGEGMLVVCLGDFVVLTTGSQSSSLSKACLSQNGSPCNSHSARVQSRCQLSQGCHIRVLLSARVTVNKFRVSEVYQPV